MALCLGVALEDGIRTPVRTSETDPYKDVLAGMKLLWQMSLSAICYRLGAGTVFNDGTILGGGLFHKDCFGPACGLFSDREHILSAIRRW